MSTLYELFGVVRDYGRSVRSQGGEVDGRAAWQPVKKWAQLGSIGVGVWVAPHATAQALAKYDPRSEYKRREGGGEDKAHYIYQLYQIPASEVCNLQRVLQVAYNIGQTDAVIAEYTPEDLKVISGNKLDQPSTYVSLEFPEVGEASVAELKNIVSRSLQALRGPP